MPPVKISQVELRRLRLPLLEPLRASYGTETHRDVLLVRVVGPETDGIGECCAMESPRYTSEFVDGAHLVLRKFLVPQLDAHDVTSAGLGQLLAPFRGHPFARAALEGAVLDAELKLTGQSMADRFGATRSRIPAGVVVGLTDTIDDLVRRVEDHLGRGYQRVKLKIRPGWDVEPVRAVRNAFGDALPLSVDANGSYALSDTRRLQALDQYGLAFVEQPLPDDDLRGHVDLARSIGTPICLDESITSLRSALDAIERGACRAISIKPGRVGGYLEAQRIHDLCVARGIALSFGGMMETGIGRSAAIALAALPGFSLPGDLSASDRYFARDLTAPIRIEDGHLRVPTGPGNGAIVDHNFIAEITTQRESIPLSR